MIYCNDNLFLIFLLQYFETDDPMLYKSKIRYIEENNIEDMELTFSEEEYEDGQLVRVRIHLYSVKMAI